MTDRRRVRWAWTGVLAAATLAIASCGVEEDPDAAPDVEPTEYEVPEAPSTETAPDPAPTNDSTSSATAAAVPETASAEPVTAAQQLDQPAVWPAADVVFATPEEAAADFVSSVLISDGDPSLGEFQQGDSRSGEIEVLFAGESGDLDPPQTKGTLFLRRLGPSDGWFVIAATSPGATIDTPSTGDTVPAGALTVAGEGRGFESTLNVTAFSPGEFATPIDSQIGAGGPFEDLEPYSVELDLSTAQAGEVVAIVVRGDSGLGNDPSTFAAIPVVIDAGDGAGAEGEPDDTGDDGTGDDSAGEDDDSAPATTIPATQ